jgi:hypothetical protein
MPGAVSRRALAAISKICAIVSARPITFKTVDDLANMFSASRTAAAIRLVELGSFPCMLVYYGRDRRRKAATDTSEK